MSARRCRWNQGRLLLLAGVLTAAAAGVAWAAADGPGRYTISPTEGGVIRLDRETGAMSFCSGTGGDWSCKAMPDSESALKKRIEELEAEKRALQAERLREGAPAGPPAKAPEPSEPPAADAVPPAPPGDLEMPTERDVDKLFDYVEGMVRKFKERIERLEREAQKKPEVPL